MIDARRQEIEWGIAVLRSQGVCWAEWARKKGFSPQVVRAVRTGRSKCLRGSAFRVGEALREVACGSRYRPLFQDFRDYLFWLSDQEKRFWESLDPESVPLTLRPDQIEAYLHGFRVGITRLMECDDLFSRLRRTEDGFLTLAKRDRQAPEDVASELADRASDGGYA